MIVIKWLKNCKIEVTETGDEEDIVIESREKGIEEPMEIFHETVDSGGNKLVQFRLADWSITMGVPVDLFEVIKEVEIS